MLIPVCVCVFLSLLCGMSDVRRVVAGKKGGSLVTPSHLFYFIAIQMTNKTWFLWDFRLTDKAAKGRPAFMAHSGNGTAVVVQI